MNNLNIKADATLLKADAVLLNAENINNNNVDVQNQLDNIILESGTSDAEVVQSRTDSNGKTFPLLKDRLNNIDKSILSRGANVIDFGAVGDGVTDDTQAFKDALGSGYKTVYAPNKKFLITDTLRVEEDNMKLLFEGEILFGTPNIATLIVNGDDCYVEVNINGQNKSNLGIHSVGKNNLINSCKVTNIYSDESFAYGINVNQNGRTTVENCFIDNVVSVGDEIFGNENGASRGIRVNGLATNVGETKLLNNTITNIGGEEGDALHFIAPGKDRMNVLVSGNTIHTFTRRAAKMQCSGVVFEGNNIENYTNHSSLTRVIDVQSVDDTVIRYNDINVEFVPCFGLVGTTSNIVGNTKIYGNNIQMSSNLAVIYTDNASGVMFNDNTIVGGGTLVLNGTGDLVVDNNKIKDSLITTSEYLISNTRKPDNITISNNKVFNTFYHRPIRTSATNVRIVGNLFPDGYGGIELTDGSGVVANNVLNAANAISTSEVGYTVGNNILI